MKSVTRKAPRAKVSSECKVLRAVELVQGAGFGSSYAVVNIHTAKDTAMYTVQRVRSDLGGTAALFVKQGQVEPQEDGTGHYHVLLAGDDSSCECRGWLRWGNTSARGCRHLYALEVAVRRGWI